jgi:hypothetical protein
MTTAEREMLAIVGDLLVERGHPLTLAEIACMAEGSVRSTAAILSNLTRASYYDARPTFSDGVHSDGALYGPTQGIDRQPWVEKAPIAPDRYQLTEEGWYRYFRDLAARQSGHFGTSHETLQDRAREQFVRFGGTPSFITTPHEDV